MNTPTKYCVRCLADVTTKQIGRNIHCAKCNTVLEELPISAVLSEPSRPAGFGTAPTRTKPRRSAWSA